MTTQKTAQEFINRITLDSFKYLDIDDFDHLREIHQRDDQGILYFVKLCEQRQKLIQAAAEKIKNHHKTLMSILETDGKRLETVGAAEYFKTTVLNISAALLELCRAEAELKNCKQGLDSLQFIKSLLTEYISRRRKFAEKFNSLNAFPSPKVQVYRPLHVVETSFVSVSIH